MGDTALSAESQNSESAAKALLPGIVYSASSDPGVGLEENQDAYTAFETKHFKVFMVADGMGSKSHGRDIALRSLSSIQFSLHKCEDLTKEELQSALEKANKDVQERAAELKDSGNLAATLLGLAFTKDRAFLINAGNSRLYRIRGSEITQLSDDHTVEGQLRRGRGEKQPLPAGSRPAGHLLTSALGLAEKLEVDIKELSEIPEKGDTYLLCTDGLYDVIAESRMKSSFDAQAPFKKIVRRLVSDARRQGSTDNITAVALRLDEVPESYASLEIERKKAAEEQERLKQEQAAQKKQEKEKVDAATVPVPARREGSSEQRRGRTLLGAGSTASGAGTQLEVSNSDKNEQAKNLRRAFNPSSLHSKQELRSTGHHDPFSASSQDSATDRKSGAKFTVPGGALLKKGGLSSGHLVGIGIAAVVVVLVGAGWMASQFKFQQPSTHIAKVAPSKPAVQASTQKPIDHLQGPSNVSVTEKLINEERLTKEEAKRLLSLAREVQQAKDYHTYKVLLENEPELSFDEIENVEMRNLMLNVYSAIQQAVLEGEKRVERLSEESIRLAESVERLTTELAKLEANVTDVVDPTPVESQS